MEEWPVLVNIEGIGVMLLTPAQATPSSALLLSVGMKWEQLMRC